MEELGAGPTTTQHGASVTRFNALDVGALAMIAEHRPENETLLQTCRLVDGVIDGARTVVVRRRIDDRLDLVSLDVLPVELHAAITAHAMKDFDRLEQPGSMPRREQITDPTAPETRSVWCLGIAALGERPTSALYVSNTWTEPADWALDVFHRAARLVQIAAEQASASQTFAATIAAERESLANQLHDDPVQSITVLSLMLQRLARDVPIEYVDAVNDARTHADRAIDRMRKMLFDLHPVVLDDDGLSIAIQVYLEESLDPLGIAWTLDDQLRGVPERSTAVLAYRLAHEVLANAAHHASATAVSITLSDDDHTLTIGITDNGRGFDPATIPRHQPGHLGLSNVRYLARRAAGRVDITSAPGSGCTVEIRLPMNERIHADTPS